MACAALNRARLPLVALAVAGLVGATAFQSAAVASTLCEALQRIDQDGVNQFANVENILVPGALGCSIDVDDDDTFDCSIVSSSDAVNAQPDRTRLAFDVWSAQVKSCFPDYTATLDRRPTFDVLRFTSIGGQLKVSLHAHLSNIYFLKLTFHGD
jgi:hypothetical protein